jgi:hypothetical protein
VARRVPAVTRAGARGTMCQRRGVQAADRAFQWNGSGSVPTSTLHRRYE